MRSDEHYMRRCLQLAQMGNGSVAPNPMVGSVIVYNDQIIGEGYHQQYGGPHAEVNAVQSVQDPTLLKDSTIYVTLEPCSHYGKTPPCADLIVRHQFKRVVIGAIDSHSKVAGTGIERIKNAGIQVSTGVLEADCRALNKHFFTYHEQQRPYILLKWAQTQNGLLDNSQGQQGEVSWISAPETKPLVHLWRHQHHAILVGKNTVLADNPSLTVRAIDGSNPIRIVLDNDLSLDPKEFAVFDDSAPTFILNNLRSGIDNNIQYVHVNTHDLPAVLKALHELHIQSILIEGGAATLQSFIDAGLWDEARVITGKTTFTAGTPAPILPIEAESETPHFNDLICYYFNQ